MSPSNNLLTKTLPIPFARTASANTNSFGKTALASLVSNSLLGIAAIKCTSSNRDLVHNTWVKSIATDTTKPPAKAGAILSGWPSISLAMLIFSSIDQVAPAKISAMAIPATMAEDDDPKPRAVGMSLVIFK